MSNPNRKHERFHGAFTGGFSAGYHNTVGSIGGFQPKSFTSSRRSKGESSKFSHSAEDYMDEEDFGEFGIAPKKIRVSSVYSDTQLGSGSSSSLRVRQDSLDVSIGEKILRNSTRPSLLKRNDVDSIVEVLNKFLRVDKNNFHGLGYKPLKPQFCSSTITSTKDVLSNPIIAVLKDGQKLKIAGEAFGSGIEGDDEDQMDHYGSIIMRDKVSTGRLKKRTESNESTINRDQPSTSSLLDDALLPGFLPSKRNNVINFSDTSNLDFKPPKIPDDWVPTVRQFDLKQKRREAISESKLEEFKLAKFDRKFTSPSSSLLYENDCRSGLISYSQLRADNVNEPEENVTNSEKTERTFMKRQELNWTPCSLLCKHFNVPYKPTTVLTAAINPSKGTQENLTETSHQSTVSCTLKPMPLELRKLIFNVTFEKEQDYLGVETMSDDEEQPQVELKSRLTFDMPAKDNSPYSPQQTTMNQECYESSSSSDVIVVEAVCKDPEVILISSSSSDHSDDDPHYARRETKDLYGPPIPPFLKVLDSHNRKKKKKSRKRKKEKKHSRSKQ